jgi:hypothetical protein
MAERPIFLPAPNTPELVKEISCQIVWNPGFAPVQKSKNIKALHEAAAKAGYSPLLEVSTKSEENLGRHLSSFHLCVQTAASGEVPLECAYQGSKVFENGGPYTDLFLAEPHNAKRDLRIKNSGRLVAFQFESIRFPLEPKTIFYDWLYINAIFPHRGWLIRLRHYAGFTDIEFNPERSINCQARSCALFVALMAKNLLDGAAESPESFMELISHYSYHPHLPEVLTERTMFG